jgi:hypothetical protein
MSVGQGSRHTDRQLTGVSGAPTASGFGHGGGLQQGMKQFLTQLTAQGRHRYHGHMASAPGEVQQEWTGLSKQPGHKGRE